MQESNRNNSPFPSDDDSLAAQSQVSISFDHQLLRNLVTQTLNEAFEVLEWPAGRICLTEEEAAAACGVGRHVLRDLRLSGRLHARKLGKRYVYLKCDLLEVLENQSTSLTSSTRITREKK